MKLHRIAIALTVVLALLKLTIWKALSWWWVFAPIYVPVAITVLLILIAIIGAAIVDVPQSEADFNE